MAKAKRSKSARVPKNSVAKQVALKNESACAFPAENPNPVLRISREGTILYCNEAGLPILNEWKCEVGEPATSNWCKIVTGVFKSGTRRELQEECGDRTFSFELAPIAEENYVNVYGKDVTERNKAEEALRQSEERFRSTLDNMIEGCQIIGRDWRYLYINDAAERHNRRPKEELLGKRYMDMWPEIESTHMFEVIRRCMEQRTPESLQNEFTFLDKTIGWFDLRIEPVPEGVFILSMDITARKKAEEALRESEEKFRTIVETADEGIVIGSPEGSYTYVNKKMVEMLGYPVNEILGKSSLDFVISEDEKARILDSRRELHKGRTTHDEFRIRRKDGSVFWSHYNAAPIFDAEGQHVANLAIWSDVTERKKAEQSLETNLSAISRLQKIGALFVNEGNLNSILPEILDTAIAISNADFGNIQLLDPKSNELSIVAQQGFPQWWLDYWNKVSKGRGTCGVALERGERVIVEDVEKSPIFMGTPSLEIQLNAGVRAIQSTPMISTSGKLIGMFSTHFKKPNRPDDNILNLLDMLARHAADILDRLHMEEALKINEEKYAQLLLYAPTAIFEIDYKIPRFKSVNDAMCRLSGYPREELLRMNPFDLLDGESKVSFQERLEKGAAGEKIDETVEFKVHTKERRELWTVLNVKPTYKDGKLDSALVVGHDVTERRNAEEAVRKAHNECEIRVEERTRELHEASLYTRSLIEASLDPLVTISADGKITDVNKATEDVTGLSREQLIGSDFSDYFTEPEKAEEGYGKVFTEGFVKDYPLSIRHKSGKITDVLYNATLYKNETGEIQGVFAAARDVTERKRAEEALLETRDKLEIRVDERTMELRESQHDLNRAQTVAKTGSWRLDVQHNVLLWSDETYDMFGVRKGTALTYDIFLSYVHPDDREYVDQSWKAALQGENYDIEHRINVNGEVKWVHEKAELEFNENQDLLGGFGTVQDITERKQMEEKLEDYAQNLERLVEEKTKQLKDSERLAAIGQTAGMVGHDIRNPLQSIEGAVYLAKEELKSLPTESSERRELEEMIELIQSQANYIDHIIEDLQDFARTPTPHREETNITEFVHESLSSIKVPENIRIRIDAEENIPRLTVDPTLMKRVILNLGQNAVQAMPKGGELTVKIHCDEKAAYVCITDTGIGIREEDKPRLFTPLFTTKAKGQGFGLAVCKKFVEAHGGEITVKSEVGKGSTFTVKLPLSGRTGQD